MSKKTVLVLALIMAAFNMPAWSQKKSTNKYPSLLWEITGKGMKKPSYLFGTMHVSSKMVFHLSDSFYHAIKNVEVVALELNPDIWQGQMVRLDKLKQNYSNFVQAPTGDFLNEQSFRINKYEEELKLAMSTEPTVVNSLLYRSYKAKEDFEEDTFLDLYIFQTGKKLGKIAAGVEDYYETEKVVLEAYTDMAKEKKKKTVDMDGESMYDVEEKIQDAYRKGNLDLMDSLDRMMERSDAFREKFLYKRNEIQAHSIDTILRKNTLFVGVGAAHLPGKRGIIDILRQKGYTLRPIMMNDRDASQKEAIDKLKVPVNFLQRQSDDGFYSVSMPGPLFNLSGEYQRLDRRQYSDMSNGCYYLVTRVKTYAAFVGHTQATVQKKIDSILYENIPGKIISRKNIMRNGYPGLDVTNRTRRGDLQRYHIFVTPFEVILFKMGGKENYVEGKEADQFFSSIRLTEQGNSPIEFQPGQGGFSVMFPQQPDQYLKTVNADDMNRWEYQAVDKTTGDAYLLFKKSVHNFRFLDQDSFDLSLVEESFRSSDYFDKQLSRKAGMQNGYPTLEVIEKMKDGATVQAKFLIRGPHYYLMARRSNNSKSTTAATFFNSFRLKDPVYTSPQNFVDTFLRFKVLTPVAPELDESIRALIEKASEEMANGNNYSGYSGYWPKIKSGLFKSDSTGETIAVSVQEYPRYFNIRDAAKFWEDEIADYYDKNDLLLYQKDSFLIDGQLRGFRFSLRDTGSSRTISRLVILKDNYSFSLVSLGDTSKTESAFIRSFYNSFMPLTGKNGRNIFENRLDEFFNDLFSKDSITRTRAQESISNIYYGEAGVPKIMQALQKLNLSDKQYFDSKARLIAELGFIKDTTRPVVVQHLKKLFELTADTSLFQNQVFLALARHKTAASYSLLKELLLQDPPIFENGYDYSGLFRSLEDSLQLTRTLFPDILQLSSLEDYKERLLSLLVTLVDSNHIKASDYEQYFAKIYFDAKIELKKQQGKDEKRMEEESSKEEGDNNQQYNSYSSRKSSLDNYAVLIMPFYDRNVNVQKFFERLLRSNDPEVKLNAAVLLLRNNKNVPDSILNFLAKDDQYRGLLYSELEGAKRLDRFPKKYYNQPDLSRSLLVADKGYKPDSIVLVGKQPASFSGRKGTVYFYKYRMKKEDDWKMGISGLQPENTREVSSDDRLVIMTDKKIKPDEPMLEQFQKQLKKLLFTFHKSGKNFFGSDDYGRTRGLLDYDN